MCRDLTSHGEEGGLGRLLLYVFPLLLLQFVYFAGVGFRTTFKPLPLDSEVMRIGVDRSRMGKALADFFYTTYRLPWAVRE
jgi:hypothetical protein